MKKTIAQLALVLLVAACGQPGNDDAADHSATTEIDSAVYADAISNPYRSETDRGRDANRKPAEVLEFFSVAPGMTVLDLFSGGGYYAEILARVVGTDGQVIAQTNEAYLGFVGDEFNARYADNRLPNVEVLMAENNELELETQRFDIIIMALSYHDLYYAAPQRGWSKIDAAKLLAELLDGLRPGGVLGIIDHYAEAGAPRETGGTLHRIDPSIVIAELKAAGFELDATSDLLRNTDDDHSKVVFDPSVRGRTDRFVLRFRKPR